LFVLGVFADHAHDAFAAHDLAVFTNPSDARSNFHYRITLTVALHRRLIALLVPTL
jgi:hypothetical protein